MATTLIHNGAFSGALGAMLDGRAFTSADPADYATVTAAAAAFATEFLTANAALAVPMTDVDNAEIGQLCAHAARGALAGRISGSATAADYAAIASSAVAAAKEGVASLV